MSKSFVSEEKENEVSLINKKLSTVKVEPLAPLIDKNSNFDVKENSSKKNLIEKETPNLKKNTGNKRKSKDDQENKKRKKTTKK